MMLIKIFFCFLVTLTVYSQDGQLFNMQNSPNRQLDKKAFPLSTNGKFLVTGIFISPNIYSWEGDRIGTNFQNGNTTELGKYLTEKFKLDTLANLYIQEEKLWIVYDSILINKQFLDSTKAAPMQPIFKPSRLQQPGFTYEIPLMFEGDKELAQAYFTIPGTLLSINRKLQETQKIKPPLIYHVKIEAEMTHHISRQDHKKLIPLFPK